MVEGRERLLSVRDQASQTGLLMSTLGELVPMHEMASPKDQSIQIFFGRAWNRRYYLNERLYA